jgi:glucan phosphoethanolaminetransferase (alkaline phosphatase superfamily)
MENDILEKVPEGNVYSTKTIVVSSFFGGLLASGYMLYHNFKAFGDDRKAKFTILVSILAFTFMFGSAFIPSLDKVPSILYSLFATLATSFFAKKYQAGLISMHLDAGGKTFETGRAVAVCIISLLLLLALVMIPYLLQDQLVST